MVLPELSSDAGTLLPTPLRSYTTPALALTCRRRRMFIRPYRLLLSTARRMAQEFNVIVYDKPGTDRTQVRPQHVAAIPATVNSGIVKLAGAIYQDEARTKFAGSTFHLVAENKQAVLDFLKQDIYAKEGIWDLDNVVINPVGIAVRLPKQMDGVEASLYKI